MELQLKANDLHTEEQVLKFEKIATLIGENGSGKSKILYSIYEDCTGSNDFPCPIVIGFSSGLNERFSHLNRRLKKNFNSDEIHTASYFYDKSWAKLIIFLASCLETGHTKSFLIKHNYFEDLNKEVTLNFKFRVKKTYIDKAKAAELQELKGTVSAFLQNPFHKKLSVFIEEILEMEDYDFSYPIKPVEIQLDSSILNSPIERMDFHESSKSVELAAQDIDFLSEIMDILVDESAHDKKQKLGEVIQQLMDYMSPKIKKEILNKFKSNLSEDTSELESMLIKIAENEKAKAAQKQEKIKAISDQRIAGILFFTEAALEDAFVLKKSMDLRFGDLTLEELSDGEYQLLFIYSLIDLFDSENTLFLFDEADSHLHYKNVEKLWALLHGIKGHAITTTHLLDSISAKENRIEHLKVVEKGRINDDNKIKQLINRLSVLSRAKSVEFEVCGKLPNIALLDDYNDWVIFIKLAARKGLDVTLLSQVHAIGKPSSRNDDNEQIGKAKVDWTQSLSKTETNIETTNVFLVCDRDNSNPRWHENGVLLLGAPREEANRIRWPGNRRVQTHLLAWRRREIENYLLSYSALTHFGILNAINSDKLAQGFHLRDGDPGDNDGIRMLDVKHVVNPLIENQGFGKDLTKIEFYINQMKPKEISEDITNMYNFIIGKL
jgi:energy-coupling factor transporter ATP-binding protein EcfA2